MSLSAEAVTKILETRFDWYSARAVLRQAAERIGAAPGGPFDAKALVAMAEALPGLNSHVEGVAAALRAAAETAAKPAAPAPKAPEPAPAVEAAPAESAAAEAAPAEGGDDAKKDAKGGGKKK